MKKPCTGTLDVFFIFKLLAVSTFPIKLPILFVLDMNGFLHYITCTASLVGKSVWIDEEFLNGSDSCRQPCNREGNWHATQQHSLGYSSTSCDTSALLGYSSTSWDTATPPGIPQHFLGYSRTSRIPQVFLGDSSTSWDGCSSTSWDATAISGTQQ
jgi:hypothetical protein